MINPVSIPHIHAFQRIPIVIHTFSTLRPFLTILKAISSQIGVYTVIGLGINDLFLKVTVVLSLESNGQSLQV